MVKMNLKNYTIAPNMGVTRAEILDALPEIPSLIKKAQSIILDSPFSRYKLYVGHSGGKDSVVVHYLASSCIRNILAYHTVKPKDTHPLTWKFLNDVEADLFQQRNMNDYSRGCIHLLFPGYKPLGMKTQIDGTRKYEFDRTNGRSTDFVQNGVSKSRQDLDGPYVKDGLMGLNFIYPIWDWTDAQVWACIFSRELPFSEEYLV